MSVMDIREELLALAEVLDRARICYALCGGLALAVHGHPRATTDIDLLIDTGDLVAVLDAVWAIGFKFPALPMTFDRGTNKEQHVQRVSKVAGEETMTLDLLLVGPPLHVVWAGREDYLVEGRTLTVVSREGLASMKRLAGRPQDLADLASLGVELDSERRP